MPRSGPTYSLPSPEYPAVSGATISSTTRNTIDSDIATALTNSVPRDGSGPMTANWAFGGYNLTGVATLGAVTGTISGNATVGGTLGVTGLATMATGLTVTAGGLTVSAGGASITGNSTIAGTLGSLTGLTMASGLVTLSASGLKFSDGTTQTTAPTTFTPSGSITASGYTQSTARILGRTTAGTGALEEISIGSGLSLSAGTLSNTTVGGRTSIASGSLSGTTLSLTSIPATYAYLVLQITGMSLTTNTTPTLRVSTNNGVSYDSTAANYGGLIVNIDVTPTTTNSKISTASLTPAIVLNNADTATITVVIKPYAGGTYAQWTTIYSDGANNVATVTGVYKSTSAINALQLAGGTFDAGTYQLDGVS